MHITELTSNVTVAVQRSTNAPPALPLANRPAGDAVMAAPEDLPTPRSMPPRVVTLPDSGGTQATGDTGASSEVVDQRQRLTATVDPRALAERVLRLWREDLKIALERE